MILADTSGLLALLDRGEREHGRVRKTVQRDAGPLLTTDFVLAELDYLILQRLGARAERDFVEQVADGLLLREPVSDPDLRRAHAIQQQMQDQALGLTDATLMALSERLECRRVLTLDRRHFGLFRDRKGKGLELLPGP